MKYPSLTKEGGIADLLYVREKQGDGDGGGGGSAPTTKTFVIDNLRQFDNNLHTFVLC